MDTGPWDDEELLFNPDVDKATDIALETREPEMKEKLELLDMVLLAKLKLAVEEDLVDVCVNVGLDKARARCRRGAGAAGPGPS